MKRVVAAFVILAATSLTAAHAVLPDEVMSDPAKEARARELSRELRCMVCQNQSIDESDADLARDLRILVRQRLVAGDTDQQVMDYIVSRYGEFVLLKPRFERQTWLLWLITPAVLAGGAVVLWTNARRRRKGGGSDVIAPPLTSEEEARLEALMGGKQPAEKT